MITSCKFFAAENSQTQPMGHVTDLIIDVNRWKVRFVVVETLAPNPRRVMIAPSAISNIDCENHTIYASLTPHQLAPSAPLKSRLDSDDEPLCSAAEVRGFTIVSHNGPTGSMQDLVVDLAKWTVDYATAQSQTWLASACSMFSTECINEVDRLTRQVKVDLRQEVLRSISAPARAACESTVAEPVR